MAKAKTRRPGRPIVSKAKAKATKKPSRTKRPAVQTEALPTWFYTRPAVLVNATGGGADPDYRAVKSVGTLAAKRRPDYHNANGSILIWRCGDVATALRIETKLLESYATAIGRTIPHNVNVDVGACDRSILIPVKADGKIDRAAYDKQAAKVAKATARAEKKPSRTKTTTKPGRKPKARSKRPGRPAHRKAA